MASVKTIYFTTRSRASFGTVGKHLLQHSYRSNYREWTTYCDPAAATVGGLCVERLKTARRLSKWWCRCTSGDGQTPLLLWRWLAAESSLRALSRFHQYEDFQGPQQYQKAGFQCEKDVKRWQGPDTMVKEWKEAAHIADLVSLRPVFASEHLIAGVYRELFWDSMWSSGSKGRILVENTSLRGFSTCPHGQEHPAVVDRILDWPPYSSDLNQLDFAIWCVLKAKSQATHNTKLDSLRRSIAKEGNQLEVEFIWRTCCPFHHSQKAIANKNEVEIEEIWA